MQIQRICTLTQECDISFLDAWQPNMGSYRWELRSFFGQHVWN